MRANFDLNFMDTTEERTEKKLGKKKVEQRKPRVWGLHPHSPAYFNRIFPSQSPKKSLARITIAAMAICSRTALLGLVLL